MSRWWQLKYFLFSPRKLGKMNPFWRAYFSTGLVQPPTRTVADKVFYMYLEPKWPLNNASKRRSFPIKTRVSLFMHFWCVWMDNFLRVFIMVHQVNIARSEADAQEPKSHGKGCNENTYTCILYICIRSYVNVIHIWIYIWSFLLYTFIVYSHVFSSKCL